MLKTRLSNSIIALGLTVAAGSAAALGFGEFRATALLGQPLNVAVPVTLAEGETLTSDCVSAEVQLGDSRLPPGSVRARITQGRDASEAVIRIVSNVPIDEPVVNLTVSAGCPTRITRSLVLLADPPLVSVEQPATAATLPRAADNLPRTAPVAAGSAQASTAGSSDTTAGAAPRATRPAAPTRAARAATPAPTARSADAAVPAAQPAAAPRQRPAASARTAPRGEGGRPRLQLDGGQVAAPGATPSASPAPAAAAAPSPAQVAAEQQAAAAQEATKVAEAAASAAQQRMKDMESEVARLRADAKAQTDALVELRKQLAQDRDRDRGAEAGWFLPALLALAGVLGATALWLWWKLKQQQQVRVMQRDAWYERGAPAASVGAAAASRRDEEDEDEEEDSRSGLTVSRIPSTLPPPLPPTPAPRPQQPTPSMFDTRAGGLDSMISPPTMPAHTAVTIGNSAREDEALRAVSVDEQIDLEQQADFFIALGHDESAIDLLMAHLRSTGGGTPLPFLKLLEIHRRRGDRDAYERTRVRFNQRFNSVAPDWQADPKEGRALEDYPLVVGRVQTAWPKPLDAMAELEALLFRRGAGSELFELPAYQELLFLYQLARDLHQLSQPDASSDVDVLLPISTDMAPLIDGGISLDLELGEGRAAQADKPMLELDLGSDTFGSLTGRKPPGSSGPAG